MLVRLSHFEYFEFPASFVSFCCCFSFSVIYVICCCTEQRRATALRMAERQSKIYIFVCASSENEHSFSVILGTRPPALQQ